ncbi:MAG: response regulator [Deltaproteobacteria bacterium]|nr:response regulator [Deltaproteobacteria bacterium]
MKKNEEVRVLLVDDDRDFLEICRENLSREESGIQVETAKSGEECLSRLKDQHFDVVLADYWMEPGMTGLQLLSLLRKEGYAVPFIFLTARGNEGVAAEALRLGADDYLVKGVTRSGYKKLARAVMEAAERVGGSPGLEPGSGIVARTPISVTKKFELLQAIVEEVPTGILVLGPDGGVLSANSKLRMMLGLDKEAYKSWLQNLLDSAKEKLGDAGTVIYRMIEDGAPIEHLEFELDSADLRKLRVRARGREIVTHLNERAGFVLAMEDISNESENQATQKSTISELRRRLDGRTQLLENVMKRLSHDLKGPLVSISGYAELLLDKKKKFSKEEIDRQLQSIRRNALKLNKMMDELVSMRKS